MEYFPTIVPVPIRFVIFDYLLLENLVVDWKLNLSNAFLLSKLKEDYKDTIYNSNEITLDNWNTTFLRLHHLQHKKAKIQLVDQEDILWCNERMLFRFPRVLCKKYPNLIHFVPGDFLMRQEDPGLVFMIREINFLEVVVDRWPLHFPEAYHMFLPPYPIEHLPLQYWSEVAISFNWYFRLPAWSLVYLINPEHQISLWIFVHENVSYGVLGYSHAYDGRLGQLTHVYYPCLQYFSKWSFIFPPECRLTKDRIMITESLLKDLQLHPSLII